MAIKKITFYVAKSGEREKFKNHAPCFVLEKDNWDDYHYKTTFYLYHYSKNKTETPIGQLKILQAEQKSGHTPVGDKFTSLDKSFCSVGGGLSYYNKIVEKFGLEKGRVLLKRLRDASTNLAIREEFEIKDGFKTSLLRSGAAQNALDEAKSLFVEVSEEVRDVSFAFSTPIADFENHRAFFDFAHSEYLPYRLNVIIGRNGTGKTSYLANLAREYAGLGKGTFGNFEIRKPKFNSIMAVSYNPFDTFFIPNSRGIDGKNAEKAGGFLFGYKYVGIRKRIDKNNYKLKSFDELSEELKLAVEQVIEHERTEEFFEIMKPILNDGSFEGVSLGQQDVKNLYKKFTELSSGQKFVIHSIATLYVDIKDQSLILIDEPENHLHPTLLMRYLQSFRKLLELKNSYAIVSTHSPLIVQETPARYVSIFRRFMDAPVVERLSMESFGASLNEIADAVFRLSPEDSIFHTVVNRFFEEKLTEAEIRNLFQRTLNTMISVSLLEREQR